MCAVRTTCRSTSTRASSSRCIGSNGAGKTTTLRAIAGLLRPRRGVVELDGARIDGLSSAAIVARGIAHVPEGRQLFPTMTVRENLELGARTRREPSPPSRDAGARVRDVPAARRAPARSSRVRSPAASSRCAAIGRALMARPRLLMLDEPSLGLAPVAVGAIFDDLVTINRDGTTVLLVEQNVLSALRLCARAYVLENGTVTLAGTREALLADESIKRAYLGH